MSNELPSFEKFSEQREKAMKGFQDKASLINKRRPLLDKLSRKNKVTPEDVMADEAKQENREWELSRAIEEAKRKEMEEEIKRNPDKEEALYFELKNLVIPRPLSGGDSEKIYSIAAAGLLRFEKRGDVLFISGDNDNDKLKGQAERVVERLKKEYPGMKFVIKAF